MQFRYLPLFLATTFATTACGKLNGNGLFVSQKEKDATDTLLHEAQYHYDQGEFEKGRELAAKVYDNNPNSERAATLLAYIHLGLAGVDVFDLASNLIDMGTTKTTTPGQTSSSSKSASETLNELAAIIGMSQDEFLGLTQGGAPVATEISAFQSLPIYDPKSAGDARALGFGVVDNINKAIAYICPFVNETAKVAAEPRDQCTHTENTELSSNAKVHFIWSFAHLTEAVAFNTVVLYRQAGSDPNLMLRANALNSLQNNVASYATAALELASNVDEVLPVTDNASMLTAIFNDFEATINGFDAIVGLPDKMRSQIEKAFTGLKEQRDKLSSISDVTQKNNTAMKQQLTKQAKTKMQEQIKQMNDKGQLTGEDKTKICDAYKQITGIPTTDAADITECQ